MGAVTKYQDILQRYLDVGRTNGETLNSLVDRAQAETCFDTTRLQSYWSAICSLRTRLDVLPALPLFASLISYKRAYLDDAETVIMARQRGNQAHVAAATITLFETQQRLVVERERIQQVIDSDAKFRNL